MDKRNKLLITLVICLAFAIPSASAADITADRVISPTTVAPGETVTVTVTVNMDGVIGAVLEEDVPAGWTITTVDNDGATYKAGNTSWLWSGGPHSGTKTVVYDVTVAGDATAGLYQISGVVLATVDGSAISDTVTGNVQVTVVTPTATTTPTPTATATPTPTPTPTPTTPSINADRVISPTTVVPGGTFTVTVTVNMVGVIGVVLEEDVPVGWTITTVDNDGATYNAGNTSWLWSGGPHTGTKTVVYDVTVPSDGVVSTYAISGDVLATVGGTTLSNTVTGNDQVTVSTATIAGDRVIDPMTVASDDTFTVTVTVTMTGAVYGPILDEAVPAGWTVTEVDNAGATYNAGNTSWLWNGGPYSGTMTLVYNVAVPDGTDNGTYPVTGEVLGTTVIGAPIGPSTVTGDNEVEVDNKPIILPEVEVTYPNGGDTLCGNVLITAQASDSDGYVTNVEFLISDDGGATWSHIGDDSTAPYECLWDTSMSPNSTDYLVKAIATDNDSATAQDMSDAEFEVVNPCQGIPLKEGWNYISFPGALDNATPEYVLEGLAVDRVMHYNADIKIWEGVSEFKPRTAYVIKVPSEQTIENLEYKPDVPTIMQLYEGWNSVGLIGTVPGTETNDAETEFQLGGIDDSYSLVRGPWNNGYLRTGYNQNVFDPIDGEETVNKKYTENYPMKRYEGHWILMDSDAELL